MSKKRIDVNWKRETGKDDLKPAVKRYRRYLEDKRLRPSSIPMYVLHVGKYLEFSGTDAPSIDDFWLRVFESRGRRTENRAY